MPDDHRSFGETLYERDFHLWAERQAVALLGLRAALAHFPTDLPGLGNALAALDLENVAEEIDGLARSDRRQLRSRTETIVEHLLELECATQFDPRRGWRVTILRERSEVARLIEESPSLRGELDGALAEARRFGAGRAFAALLEHGDMAGAERVEQRGAHHLGADAILGDWLPEAPD